MSRIKRLVRPEDHSMNWKTAVTLIATTIAGFTLAANAATPVASPQVAEAAMVATAIPEKEAINPVENKGEDVVISAHIDFEKKGCRPEYPRAALASKLRGITTLAVIIAKSGEVAEVKVLKSSGHEILDDAVKTKLLSGSCRVTPGTINGAIQKTTTQVQYVWMLDTDDSAKKNQLALAQGTAPTKPSTFRPAKINFDAPGCKPEYPRASLRNEEQGITKLDVHITETGAIDHVQVLRSSKFEGLDNAVREQLLKGSCIAKPALNDGKSVASNAMVTYLWKLD